jgi:hypothetical protein
MQEQQVDISGFTDWFSLSGTNTVVLDPESYVKLVVDFLESNGSTTLVDLRKILPSVLMDPTATRSLMGKIYMGNLHMDEEIRHTANFTIFLDELSRVRSKEPLIESNLAEISAELSFKQRLALNTYVQFKLPDPSGLDYTDVQDSSFSRNHFSDTLQCIESDLQRYGDSYDHKFHLDKLIYHDLTLVNGDELKNAVKLLLNSDLAFSTVIESLVVTSSNVRHSIISEILCNNNVKEKFIETLGNISNVEAFKAIFEGNYNTQYEVDLTKVLGIVVKGR